MCNQKRISGPLMDRIDIHMQVPRVEFQKLRDMRPGETSAEVRMRVEAARERQRQRCEETSFARGHQEAVVTLVERKSCFLRMGLAFLNRPLFPGRPTNNIICETCIERLS
jgi:predicted ATPase with chaperone activity